MNDELLQRARDLAFEEAIHPGPNGEGRTISFREYEEARDRIYAELVEQENEQSVD
jgi:hypothetical protein